MNRAYTGPAPGHEEIAAKRAAFEASHDGQLVPALVVDVDDQRNNPRAFVAGVVWAEAGGLTFRYSVYGSNPLPSQGDTIELQF